MPAQPKNFDAAARDTFIAAGVGLVWFAAGWLVLALGGSAVIGWATITVGLGIVVAAAVLAGLILREGRELVERMRYAATGADADQAMLMTAVRAYLDYLEGCDYDSDEDKEMLEELRADVRRVLANVSGPVEGREASMLPMPALDPELKEGLRERKGVGLDVAREEARRAVVVDFLASWRYCPLARSENASRGDLEDAAKQLLDALAEADRASADHHVRVALGLLRQAAPAIEAERSTRLDGPLMSVLDARDELEKVAGDSKAVRHALLQPGAILLTVAMSEPPDAGGDTLIDSARQFADADIAIDLCPEQGRARVSKYRFGPTDSIEVVMHAVKMPRPL